MECLLDTDVGALPTSIRNVEGHNTLRSVLTMIGAADCNASRLELIGIHGLLTEIIADLILHIDPRIRDLGARRKPDS